MAGEVICQLVEGGGDGGWRWGERRTCVLLVRMVRVGGFVVCGSDRWSDGPDLNSVHPGVFLVSWLGTQQRSDTTYGNLILMGARLYTQRLGRFLTPDPIHGGNENTYTYPNDPITNNDVTGLSSWWQKALATIAGDGIQWAIPAAATPMCATLTGAGSLICLPLAMGIGNSMGYAVGQWILGESVDLGVFTTQFIARLLFGGIARAIFHILPYSMQNRLVGIGERLIDYSRHLARRLGLARVAYLATVMWMFLQTFIANARDTRDYGR